MESSLYQNEAFGMTRYLGLLLIIAAFCGCGTSQPPKMEKAIDATEVSRQILTYSEKLRFQKHLQLEDSVVYYNSKINRIRLDFSSMDVLDIWEARALLVDLVDEFLERINGNAIIYRDLGTFPFTASDLEVYIYFKSFYNHYVKLDSIGMISLKQGIASYIASDGFDCEGPCWRKRNEYYFQSRNFITFKRQGEALYKPDTESDFNIFGDERYIDPETRKYLNRISPRIKTNRPR